MKLFLGNLSRAKKIITVIIIILILLSIPIAVYLVQQRQEIRKKAIETGAGKLVCDSGPNPYDSTTIVVENKTTLPVNNMASNVFRCRYAPGDLVVGFYSCETQEACDEKAPNNQNCHVGTWDAEASQQFSINPGDIKTFTMTVNPCEIAQLDTYNVDVHELESDYECYNVGSVGTNPQPPAPWPGGFAFAIKENPQGYDASTGQCPQPTATLTPTPTLTGTPAPTATGTPSPTVTGTPPPTNTPPPTPTGTLTPSPTPSRTPTPTLTPSPSKTPTPIPTSTPVLLAGATPTPTTPPPVSGSTLPTILTAVGGLIFVVVALIL